MGAADASDGVLFIAIACLLCEAICACQKAALAYRTTHAWSQSFSSPSLKLSYSSLLQLVFPLTAWAIKSALEECADEEGKEVVRKVPNGVLVFAVEGIYKAGKLAFQERGSA